MELQRSSGILLHPTSLPGPWGIGDLGPEACRFADFLGDAGQSWWQILPLGATGYGNSPYMCFSAFAGNPYLVSPQILLEEGLLTPADLEDCPSFPEERVDYGSAIEFKLSLLSSSFRRFTADSSREDRDSFNGFCEKNAPWLKSYALFMALKEAHGGRPWTSWGKGLASRDPGSLKEWESSLGETIQFHEFIQYLFFRQWSSLRDYCRRQGVRIIGDMPIYVAHDSAEVWAHPELFRLDDTGKPAVVAGVPPDYFSATGQRWGNPIYRWELMAQTAYQWWIDRFRMNFSLVDLLRLDHFRGFDAYWEIPASEPTAVKGRWVKGPGAALFEVLRAVFGDVPVIAEDLGLITAEIEALRDQFELPGMRVLQMAFGDDPKASDYRPHNYVRNCVVYTATHDHNTTAGWFTAQPEKETTQTIDAVKREREHVLEYLATDGREIHWDMIRLAMSSVANVCIFPFQDVLGLASDARMNRPGTPKGNWEWRYTRELMTPGIRERLKRLTELYERRPPQE